MAKVRTLTDVRYAEKAYERGADIEVDDETARRWIRDGWAEAIDAAAAPPAEARKKAGA